MRSHFLLGAALLLALPLAAQPGGPLSLTGFTDDIVANGPGPATASTTADMDGGRTPNSFCFVAADYVSPTGATPTSSLPLGGRFTSVEAPFPVFQLADYAAPNSLRILGAGNGTLTLAAPVPATELWLLAASGNGASTFDALVTFTDQTTQLFPNLQADDWFNASGYAIQGVSRVNRDTDNLQSSASNPRLYQISLSIAPANRAKPIQSLTFTKTISLGTLNILALSASPAPMGLSADLAPQPVRVSPNPATDRLAVQLPTPGTQLVELLDGLGRRVRSASTDAAGVATFELTALPPGVYVARADNGRGVRVMKQ